MEVLAPVGAREQLIAAVRSGADAVYLGTKDFNARKNADNFDGDDLKEAIKYAHGRGVRVYVALNTVITDSELQTAVDTVKAVATAGADAVIVQDLAMYRIVKEVCPDMPLHASTQMSVHNVEGAKELEKLGFCRIVPARELSLDELRAIRENVGIELEVFVHGALCMSVSGQCYFSAMLGSRSGNRGRCAQPCRLPFKLKGGNGYALSLKDSSLCNYLKELEAMGVKSAKIEGRMKRPEYVSAAVRACREGLDNGKVSEKTAETLKSVFSRTGFTDGYYKGKRDKNLFGYRQKEDVTSATNKLLSEIRNSYKDEPKAVGLNMSLSLKCGEKAELIVTGQT